jgi:hypothetical protein
LVFGAFKKGKEATFKKNKQERETLEKTHVLKNIPRNAVFLQKYRPVWTDVWLIHFKTFVSKSGHLHLRR